MKIPEDLRVMFSLTDRPEDREHIYTYILDKLADPHKRLLVCKKIVTEIMSWYFRSFSFGASRNLIKKITCRGTCYISSVRR